MLILLSNGVASVRKCANQSHLLSPFLNVDRKLDSYHSFHHYRVCRSSAALEHRLAGLHRCRNSAVGSGTELLQSCDNRRVSVLPTKYLIWPSLTSHYPLGTQDRPLLVRNYTCDWPSNGHDNHSDTICLPERAVAELDHNCAHVVYLVSLFLSRDEWPGVLKPFI